MTRTYITISIDYELLKIIDRKRGDIPRSRYIAQALRAFLEKGGG